MQACTYSVVTSETPPTHQFLVHSGTANLAASHGILAYHHQSDELCTVWSLNLFGVCCGQSATPIARFNDVFRYAPILRGLRNSNVLCMRPMPIQRWHRSIRIRRLYVLLRPLPFSDLPKVPVVYVNDWLSEPHLLSADAFDSSRGKLLNAVAAWAYCEAALCTAW